MMLTAISPQEVYTEVDSSPDTVWAMVRAERYGQARAHGATIVHAGYAPDATEFSAATSLYTVRW